MSRFSWRFNRGGWKEPNTYELWKGECLHAVVQEASKNSWYSYGMASHGWNTYGSGTTTLEDAKKDAMRRAKEAENS